MSPTCLPFVGELDLGKITTISGGVTLGYMFCSLPSQERDRIQRLLADKDPKISLATFEVAFRGLVEPERSKDVAYRKFGELLWDDRKKRASENFVLINNGVFQLASVDEDTFRQIRGGRKMISELDGPSHLAFYIHGSEGIRDELVQVARRVATLAGAEDRFHVVDAH